MEAFLIALISQLNSSVFVLLLMLVLAFWGMFKVGKWTERFDAHAGRLKNVESVRDMVIAIQTKVDLIWQNINPNAAVKSFSPATLTDIGKQISSNIQAEDIFSNHANKLIGMVETRNPKNAYDIQQTSFDVAKKDFVNLLNEDELKLVKDEAFKRGVLIEDIMAVFGIFLRDKILKEKNIPIADVDKHASKKS